MRAERLFGRRAAAYAVVAAALAGIAFLLWPGHGSPAYRAELTSARGLVADNDVRVRGAVAGRVRDVGLTPHGTAMVTYTLDDGVPAPRADATAAVRPVDLLGDNYLALDPGRAAAAQQGPIPVSRTSNAPRLDQLLATFAPDVRSGLRLLLVESGRALDQRRGDLAQAAIALRPALVQAGAVADEVASQNRALSDLVRDGERGVGQLARRSEDLGRLVGGLDATLRTVAQHQPGLSTTLRGAPLLLDELGGTATRLDRAEAATPVAQSLLDAAAPLGGVLEDLPALAGRLGRTSTALGPAVGALRSLLVRGGTTLDTLARTLPALRAIAPQTNQLLDELVPAAPAIAQGFFVNFADQAAEPGNQPFDPFADPRRAYWRGAAVLSCEAFGVKVEPGCLQKFLAADRRSTPPATERALDYLLGS